MRFTTAGTDRLTLDNSGNVGIGTTGPGAKFHVNGIAIFGEGAGGLPASVGKVVRGNYESVLVVGGVFAYDYGTNTPRDLILQNPGGNVGIGTSTPSDKLEVSGGNIRVTGGSFIDDGTTLNTPDYVFEEDYALMSLDEL